MTTRQELLEQIEELKAKVDAMPETKQKLKGGEEIDFEASCLASFRATYSSGEFIIKTCHLNDGEAAEWFFTAEGLRETANWFNELADMLEDE